MPVPVPVPVYDYGMPMDIYIALYGSLMASLVFN